MKELVTNRFITSLQSITSLPAVAFCTRRIKMSEQAINIKFVQEVEKHPCLYNYELGDYSRRNVTEAAWNEVGNVMNMTGAACKEKWKNLRAVFVRNIKPPPSGSGMKKKKYYLMDFMQFALPYVKTFSSKASGNLTDNSDAQEKEIVPEPVHIDDIPLAETEDITTQPVAEIQSVKKNVNQPSSISGVKRKKQPLNEVDKSFVRFFKDRQVRENDKNPRKLFLLSLLDEVDKMTDEQMRFFKRKVLHLIDDIMRPNTMYEPLQYNLHPSPADSYSTASTSTSNFTPINYGSECLEGQPTTEQQFIAGQSAGSSEQCFGSPITI